MSALAGLRVLDLSRVLAGPFCSMILGDHGADVVKVEPPTGDETRQWGPPFVGGDAATDYAGESAYFLFCNRNKRSIAIDLTTEDGQELVRSLARTADVIIENFKPGTMERWGLRYEEMRTTNPGLILASISGFGATGPYKDNLGYDVIAQAMGGIMSITGSADAGPTRVGVAIADLSTGLYSAIGILTALDARRKSGHGQRVDCSLLESIVSLLTHLASNYLIGGVQPRRYGNTHPTIVPYQIFEASDRELYVAVGNDGQFRKFCACIGRPSLAHDPRFATNPARVANRDVLVNEASTILSGRPAEAWQAEFWSAGVPASVVNDLPAVFADPQVIEREMLVEVEHSVAGTLRMTGIPIKLSDTPGCVRLPPPLLGQHTREVLKELGMDPAEIDRLHASGAVRSAAVPR